MEPWQRLLLDAADTIEKYGWSRDALEEEETGALCALGAINVAHHGYAEWEDERATGYWGETVHCEAILRLCHFLELDYTTAGTECRAVMEWNDCAERSEEVVTLLREAANARRPVPGLRK